jgi:hypothetical protein
MKPSLILTLSAAIMFTIGSSQAGWVRASDSASIVLTVKDNKDRNKHEKKQAKKERKREKDEAPVAADPNPNAQEWQNKAQEAEGRFSVGTDAVETSKENE